MFSESIERALRACLAAHQGQVRKGDDSVPYTVHPLHVALLLARLRADDEVVIAGLLHDVVEDCPGWTLARIEAEFGSHAAAIVGELTEEKQRPWEERKRAGVGAVPHLSSDAATVKAADQLHNLQSLLLDLRESSDHGAIWSRFKGGREGTLQMARALAEALSSRVEPRLSRALMSALQAVEEEALRGVAPQP